MYPMWSVPQFWNRSTYLSWSTCAAWLTCPVDCSTKCFFRYPQISLFLNKTENFFLYRWNFDTTGDSSSLLLHTIISLYPPVSNKNNHTVIATCDLIFFRNSCLLSAPLRAPLMHKMHPHWLDMTAFQHAPGRTAFCGLDHLVLGAIANLPRFRK